MFHEATLISVTKSVQELFAFKSVNVVGSLNLLKACVDFYLKKFIFASSCAVYGDNEKLPVDEESAVKPLSPYAADKVAVENYAKVFMILLIWRLLVYDILMYMGLDRHAVHIVV